MSTDTIVYQDDDVIIRKVVIPPGDTHAPEPRGQRTIIHLTDSDIERSDQITRSKHKRPAGTAVAGDASHHTIINNSSREHRSLVIEHKFSGASKDDA